MRWPRPSIHLFAQIAARVAAGLLLLMVAAITIGEGADGLPNLRTMSLTERLELVALIVIVVGLMLGFWRDLLGGVTVLLGVIAFEIIHVRAGGSITAGAFPWFFAAGLLFLFSAACGRKHALSKRQSLEA